MNKHPAIVLVVGATGSIGRLVVAEALREGFAVQALVRDRTKARKVLPQQAELVEGDIRQPNTLLKLDGRIGAIVFTHGSYGMRGNSAQEVDYGGVRNVLSVLGKYKPRIALMTTIGVTKREDARMGVLESHDWKRRAERLVRASGCPYTIVRPGWFDYNDADQHRLALLQGDTRWSGTPSDGVVARGQIAQVLVRSLYSASAESKTFELLAEHGPASLDFSALFDRLKSDAPDALDAVDDRDNMPLAEEPVWIQGELQKIRDEGQSAALDADGAYSLRGEASRVNSMKTVTNRD